MSNLNVPPLAGPGPSLTEQVYETIATMLLDSTLKPDGRTSIRELAEELGVSTMPVREAVGRLVAQGALAIRKNRAVEVPRMSRADFQELTDTRLLLECEAARRAIANITETERATIRRLEQEFSTEMRTGDRSKALMLNRQLHFALYAAAKSPTLSQMIGMAWLKAGPLISLDIAVTFGPERAAHSIAAHSRLVAALDQGDSAAAAEAIRTDISGAAATILAQRAYFLDSEDEDGPRA